MSSNRWLNHKFPASANKLRFNSIDKILKIDRNKRHKKNDLEKNASRVALAELIKNTPYSTRNNLPDFKTFLSNEDNVGVFRKFLQERHCEENINFYLACERYRSLSPDRVGIELIKLMANQIYNDFLGPAQACQPVNVDGNCSRVIRQKLKEPNPDLFHDAQAQIFELMKDGCYPDFCKNCELDRETAEKILFEQSIVINTPIFKEAGSIASSFCSDYPTNTCSSQTSRGTKRRLTLISNSECSSECSYYQRELPCHRRIEKAHGESHKRRPLPNPDLIDQIDLRKIHHVPVIKKSPPPPPLPPKPFHVEEKISDKKYPYVGKVFNV